MKPMPESRLYEITSAFNGASAPPAKDAQKMALELLAELTVLRDERNAADMVINELNTEYQCDLHDTHEGQRLGTRNTDQDGRACDECAALHGFKDEVLGADIFRRWNELQIARWGNE